MSILSIGIPTFNGEKTIVKALESIVKQIEKYKLQIEIIISDNASTDQTFEICKEYQKKISYITLIRNNVNLGYDKNVNNIVENCKTKYLWLFSDDEILTDEKALLKIISYLNNNNVAFLYLNNKNTIKIAEKKECFEDGNDFFKITKFKSGLITSNVINVLEWKNNEMRKYFGCEWIHFAYQIEALKPGNGNKAGMIYDYLFESQDTLVNNWGKGGRFLLVGIKLEEVFQNLAHLGYTKEVCVLAKNVIKNSYPENIIRARLEGLNINEKIIERMNDIYGEFLSFKIIDLFFLKCPIFVCKIMYPIIRLIKKIRGAIDE